MRDTLLDPLGMDRSTFDRAAIRADDNRAVAHVDYYPEPPIYEPVTAAGGLYSSADDLARFLLFQLGEGILDGRTVLDPDSMREMRTIPRRSPVSRRATRSACLAPAGTGGTSGRNSSTTAAGDRASCPTCGGRPSWGSGSGC